MLNFRDNTLEIHMSPDKPNIKVVTKKIANSVDQGMAWMVDALDCDNCYRDLFALEKMLKDTFCQNHI